MMCMVNGDSLISGKGRMSQIIEHTVSIHKETMGSTGETVDWKDG